MNTPTCLNIYFFGISIHVLLNYLIHQIDCIIFMYFQPDSKIYVLYTSSFHWTNFSYFFFYCWMSSCNRISKIYVIHVSYDICMFFFDSICYCTWDRNSRNCNRVKLVRNWNMEISTRFDVCKKTSSASWNRNVDTYEMNKVTSATPATTKRWQRRWYRVVNARFLVPWEIFERSGVRQISATLSCARVRG